MATSKPHMRKATIRPRKAAGQEYFIWCDESNIKGKYCSNFYGGVLVKSTHLREVLATLQQVCRKLHLFDEIKWHKVSQCYAGKYQQAMDAFFQLVAEAKTNKEIAALLNVSPSTVETHRAHIMEKLDLHSAAEIVLYAVRRGVIR